MPTIEEMLMRSDEFGVRLEMVNGIGIWEAMPAPRHQRESRRIENSIRPSPRPDSDCSCEELPDVLIRFPDGSLKRPDISIFCRRPDEEDEAVTLVPEAVIEIVSKGHEAKDLIQGIPFYLSQGVKDVVVFDPYNKDVHHARRDGERVLSSPVDLVFECGCSCTV